jgi:hypothetical protein
VERLAQTRNGVTATTLVYLSDALGVIRVWPLRGLPYNLLFLSSLIRPFALFELGYLSLVTIAIDDVLYGCDISNILGEKEGRHTNISQIESEQIHKFKYY